MRTVGTLATDPAVADADAAMGHDDADRTLRRFSVAFRIIFIISLSIKERFPSLRVRRGCARHLLPGRRRWVHVRPEPEFQAKERPDRGTVFGRLGLGVGAQQALDKP